MRVLFASLLLAASVAAQNCSTLSIGGGTGGAPLTIALQGAPASIAVVAIGQTAGSTSINLGSSVLNLGVAMPFAPVPLGITDLTGAASISVRVPANLPGLDIVAQGITLSIGGISLPTGPGLPTGGGFPGGSLPMPTLTFCTSNVVSAHVGN